MVCSNRDENGDWQVSELSEQRAGDQTEGDADDPVLSVVVVTYNEADRIESCLSAIFETCRGLSSFEVVLVDSRSTDGTVDLAAQYPVTIYRLPPDVESTPSAGRYVGTEMTTGEKILFVDGDMTLEPSWLDDALQLLESSPSIAGVDGQLNASDATAAQEVASLRGVALYERDALTDVGGFDPYLSALEDIELGFRFDTNDYRLYRTPTVAASHEFEGGFREQLRRWRSGYYLGLGEVLRKSLDSPRILLKVLYWYRQYVVGGIWFLCGIASLFAGLAGVIVWLVLSTIATVALVTLVGLDRTVQKLVSFLPVYLGAVLGFRGEHPPPAAFPVEDVEVVQRSNPSTGPQSAETM